MIARFRGFVSAHSAVAIVLVTVFIWVLPGCSQDEEISRYEVPREQAAESLPSTSTPKPQTPTSNSGTTGDADLTYQTPDGWVPGVVSGMRKAAFRVEEGDRKVEITAVDLAAGAGSLLPNVNRWRGQIQLEALTAEQLQKSARSVPVGSVTGQFVELLGPETAEPRQAILGVIAVHGPKAWFFKLWGDSDLALREKKHFQDFVKSVQFKSDNSCCPPPETANTAPKPPPTRIEPPAPPTPAAIAALRFDVPEGWMPGPVGGMRKAALRKEEGILKAEITAIDLAAAAGGLLPNVNRWREQLKLEKVTEDELKKTASAIEVGGNQGQYVELVGPKDAERHLAILGVVVIHGPKAWFFKLTGDAELALREKQHFQDFVKSIQFEPAAKKLTEKKPAAKKPAEKKPTEKKPTEKKPTEKKPTEKKPTEKKPTEKKPVTEMTPAKEVPAKKAAAQATKAEGTKVEGADRDN